MIILMLIAGCILGFILGYFIATSVITFYLSYNFIIQNKDISWFFELDNIKEMIDLWTTEA